MKTLFLALALIISPLSNASELTQSLVGKYLTDPKSCGNNHPEVDISIKKNILSVNSQTPEGTWVIAEDIILDSHNKKFNCTPAGNYTLVQCKVKETRDSIATIARECLLFCGAWNIEISLTKINSNQLAMQTGFPDNSTCLLNKLPK